MTSRTVEKRFKEHLNNSTLFMEDKYKSKSLLYSAMNKYGIENFIVETIEYLPTTDRKVLGERESYYISQVPKDMSYNIAPGGEGGALFEGHHHTTETKAQMSINRTGDKNANYGNRWTQSDELKQLHSKLSSGENNGNYGNHCPRPNISKAKKEKKAQYYNNGVIEKQVPYDEIEKYVANGFVRGRLADVGGYNKTPIKITLIENGESKIFPSMSDVEASKYLGYSVSVQPRISKALNYKNGVFTKGKGAGSKPFAKIELIDNIDEGATTIERVANEKNIGE